MNSSSLSAVKTGVTVATLILHSDRHAYTISKIADDFSWVTVKRCKCKLRTSLYEHQEWDIAEDPNASEEKYTLRKNGRYVKVGETQKSSYLIFGVADEYYDPSF